MTATTSTKADCDDLGGGFPALAALKSNANGACAISVPPHSASPGRHLTTRVLLSLALLLVSAAAHAGHDAEPCGTVGISPYTNPPNRPYVYIFGMFYWADGYSRGDKFCLPRDPRGPHPEPDPDGGGGTGGGGGGTGLTNRAPEVARELSDRALRVGEALAVDLSGAFRDPDGEALVHAAASTDVKVGAAAVDGAALTLRSVARGEAQVTVTASDPHGASVSQTFAVTVAGPEALWYLPPASGRVRQGFVRVINHTDAAGEVTVRATDDAGVAYPPLTFALGARAAMQLTVDDLEEGNAAKGLSGGTGPGTGAWRLAFESETLDVEALGYLRTRDGLGFLTGMTATAPAHAAGGRGVAYFNPGSNVGQVSRLRLVNPWAQDVRATVSGVDAAGRSPGAPVALVVPAGGACTVGAAALESGTGLACGVAQAGIGDGTRKWRLRVDSALPLQVMSLLRTPSGDLSNLSGSAAPDAQGIWQVPLFPAASHPFRRGVVRVINHTDAAGTVSIVATDDAGVEYAPLTLRLGARAVRQLDSADLEEGNAAKGLSGGTGPGTGAWHLALSSEALALEVRAYLRTDDAFLSDMQATAPVSARVHRVAFFNPASNTRRVSVLRLVNPGEEAARVTLTGTDDRGERPGTAVVLSVPGGEAVSVTAAALESGEADAIVSGALGDGAGKWRLRLEADRDITVMSLLSSRTGHLTNLSRADPSRGFETPPAP